MTEHNPFRLLQTRCFLLDMDGTFYLGGRLLPGALDFIHLLEKLGIDYLFLTNNSSKTQSEYADKIRHMGLNIPENKILTSGEATAIYLAHINPSAKLFVAGTPALEKEFNHSGFTLTEDSPDYVVLGFDTTITYAKIWKICDLITAGVPWIATHPDINCPTETGFMPDIGAMIAMIAASTGHKPDIIIGKPFRPIVDAIVEKLDLPVSKLCMVGDRLYTDIAMGTTGITTVLVLSGETQQEDLAASPYKPDYVMKNLGELAQYFSENLPKPP
jgi:4-nitrophenyl phosphatase